MWGTRQVSVHEIVMATEAHALEIWPHLRSSDLYEITAMTPLPVSEALVKAVHESRVAWTWLVDGRVVCLFGVAAISLVSGSGSPWLVATPELERHRLWFLRHCRQYIEKMRHMFPLLWNCTAANNPECMRWLQWLGFNVKEPEPMGRFNRPFRRFEMEGTCATRG